MPPRLDIDATLFLEELPPPRRLPRRSFTLALLTFTALIATVWLSNLSFSNDPYDAAGMATKTDGVNPEVRQQPNVGHGAGAGQGFTTQQGTTVTASRPLVAFADADYGYALTSDCVTDDSKQLHCTYKTWHTTDRGNEWHGFAFPGANLSNPQLITVGTDGLLVQDNNRRWFSTDHGQTWISHSGPPSAEVQSIPPEAIASVRCIDPQCISSTIVAFLPDGTFVRLAHSPEMGVPTSTAWVSPVGGALWLTGTSPGGQPLITISTNGGYKWHTTIMPASDSRYSYRFHTATRDGHHGYALITQEAFDSQTSGATSAKTQVIATDNAGLSWELRDAAAPVSTVTAAVITPSHQLVVATENGLMTSEDRGAHFRPTTDTPRLSSMSMTAGFCLGKTDSSRYFLSDDGLFWQSLSLDSVA